MAMQPLFILATRMSLYEPEALDWWFDNWPHNALTTTGPLPHEVQIDLFKLLLFARMMSGQDFPEKQQGLTPAQAEFDREWTAKWKSIRERLFLANCGLVLHMIGRKKLPLEREDMQSSGDLALLRSVDAFDPFRGYKF